MKNYVNLIQNQQKQWSMLFVYNIYRLASIITLGIVLYVSGQHFQLFNGHDFIPLFIYFLIGMYFTYLGFTQTFQLENQILCYGIIDIIVMVIFIGTLGYLQSGLGILLNGYIALLSILLPGRLAIFFASLASFMFLTSNILRYFYGLHEDSSIFFYTGIHCAGFIGTALTAWYLASVVKSSQNLAIKRTKELANFQQLNEYIVERLQYGVIYINRDEQIKVFNSAAQSLLGCEGNFNSLRDIHPEIYKKYKTFVSKKSLKQLSAKATLASPYLQIYFYAAEKTLNGLTAVLIILEDKKEVAQQAQQLKLASLGRFSASIAHELRNPLGVIAHASQLLGEESQLASEDSRLKELILSNCDRMNAVIKNVLQMSRQEKSSPEKITLSSFLIDFKNQFSSNHNCVINLKMPQNHEPSILFDKSQLEQILVILCENATIHGKSVNNQVNIYLELINKQGTHFLYIGDNGPGIASSQQDKIFEPFFSTLKSGFGMGLFIARDLCEMNQAILSVSDKKVDHSHFMVQFTNDGGLPL